MDELLPLRRQGVDSMSDRQKDDWYPTPPEATEALLSCEQFTGLIWEPACGDGAISEHLKLHDYDVVSTDLNSYGYPDAQTNIDFLMERQPLADTIITNPPYKLAGEFISHAIDLGVETHAWLLRLAFLEGKARYQTLYSKHPPAAVYVFSQRLTMIRGDHDESWYGSGKMAFCWMVWRKDWSGTPQLGWI